MYGEQDKVLGSGVWEMGNRKEGRDGPGVRPSLTLSEGHFRRALGCVSILGFADRSVHVCLNARKAGRGT